MKNLWKLSEYRPTGSNDIISAGDMGFLQRDIERKPKGQAVIVDMEEPVDMFPETKDL